MVDVSKLSPATKLSRKECADALTQAGYKTSPRTLATKATRGGGPPYQKWVAGPFTRGGLPWAGLKQDFLQRGFPLPSPLASLRGARDGNRTRDE